MYLGVRGQSKAYKLYNPITKNVVVSRDVVFDEDRFWTWSDEVWQKMPTILAEEEEEVETEPRREIQQQATSTDLPSAETESESNIRFHHSQRRWAWMKDYNVGGISITVDVEDFIAELVLFADCDPTSLFFLQIEDAVQELKWQKNNGWWDYCNWKKWYLRIGWTS